MKENRMRDALETIASRAVPEDINLMPSIAARLERKSWLQIFRLRPALAVLIVLLTLILLSGVAYAIGRVTGYIPGVGLVDQSIPLRMLIEPVSLTREGITLTVEQVVLSADKTVLVYKVEGIPPEAYADEGNEEGSSSYTSSSSINLEGTPEVSYSALQNFARCSSNDRLLLPDGSTVNATGGEGSGWSSGFERRLDYGSIPWEVNEATFTVSCIDGTSLGTLPEDWEISLHFVPAPPDVTVLPVIEVEPSRSDTPQSAITVEQVIETYDGYILGGKFRLIGYPAHVVPNGFSIQWVKFTDANGRAVEAFPASGMQFENKLNGEVSWAYEVKGRQHAFPLTIIFEAVPVYIFNETAEFEFDTGENPQIGQTWVVDQDVQLAGYNIREIFIERVRKGYEFQFKGDPDLELFTPEIKGFVSNGAGGGSDGFGRGEVYFYLHYKEEPPSGKLNVKLGDVSAVIRGPWQLQWSPEPLPESLYGISLHIDQYIPLEDGYYLIGHTEWTDDRIASVGPGGWGLRAYDMTGREVPIEPAIFDNDQVGPGLQPGQWAYHVYGKNFNGPLTLRVSQISVEFIQPIRFALDLRAHGFDFSDQTLGTTWQLDSIPLDVPGISAQVSSATYVRQGDLHGFEIAIQAERSLQGLGFSFESGLITESMSAVAGGGGSNRHESTGKILATLLTNAPMQFPLVLSASGGAINGIWETKWNAPLDTTGIAPILVEQACLDLNEWKEIVMFAGVIPPEFQEEISVQNPGLSPDGTKQALSTSDNTILVTELSTGQSDVVLKGENNIWVAGWTADGSAIVYVDANWDNNIIRAVDIETGTIQTLIDTHQGYILNAVVSPDGQWMAYSEKVPGRMTPGIYVSRLDGSERRLLVQLDYWMSTVSHWNRDGTWLVFTVTDMDQYSVPSRVAVISVETCEVRPLP